MSEFEDLYSESELDAMQADGMFLQRKAAFNTPATTLVYVVKVKHGGTVAKLIGGENLDQYVQEYAAIGHKPEGLTIEVEYSK